MLKVRTTIAGIKIANGAENNMEVVIELGIYFATSGIAFFGGLGIGFFIGLWIMSAKQQEGEQ